MFLTFFPIPLCLLTTFSVCIVIWRKMFHLNIQYFISNRFKSFFVLDISYICLFAELRAPLKLVANSRTVLLHIWNLRINYLYLARKMAIARNESKSGVLLIRGFMLLDWMKSWWLFVWIWMGGEVVNLDYNNSQYNNCWLCQ